MDIELSTQRTSMRARALRACSKSAVALSVALALCGGAYAASPPPRIPPSAPPPVMKGGVLPAGGIQPTDRQPGGAHPRNLHNSMMLKSHVTSKPRCPNKVDNAHGTCGATNRHG